MQPGGAGVVPLETQVFVQNPEDVVRQPVLDQNVLPLLESVEEEWTLKMLGIRHVMLAACFV